jgi:hypothetical protein
MHTRACTHSIRWMRRRVALTCTQHTMNKTKEEALTCKALGLE